MERPKSVASLLGAGYPSCSASVKTMMATPHPEGCLQAVGVFCCVAPHLLTVCIRSEVSLGLFSPEGKFILFGDWGVGGGLGLCLFVS